MQEVNDEEELPATEIGTTLVSTTPLTTKATHSNIVDSTSDTWSDLFPWATTEFTTTSTPAIQNETVAPKYEDSIEDDQDEKISSSENACNGDFSKTEMKQFADAMMKFSTDLLKQVHLGSKSSNVVVSPLSIALGLLQLTLGNGHFFNTLIYTDP